VQQDPVVTDDTNVSVAILDNDFNPRLLSVRRGAMVTFTHEGEIAHDVTQYEGAFESGYLSADDTYALVANTVGTFDYYCTLHHAMQGTLTVVE
jgi:plastocyanin